MTYDINLKKIGDDPFFLDMEHDTILEEDNNSYIELITTSTVAIQYLTELEYTYRYPTHATEGLISSVYDVISTAIRTAIRFVGDTAKWLGRKIKSIVNIRKRHKLYRDKKFESLTAIYNGLTAQQRVEANRRFIDMNIEYTPSFEGYTNMCIGFNTLIKGIEENVRLYVSKDVAIFGSDSAEKKSKPTWILKLYEETTTREELLRFGIKYENDQFTQNSPFKTMISDTLGSLGYDNIDKVRSVNISYNSQCWANLKSIIHLRDKFDKFERELKDKQRELSSNISKIDKKDAVAACRNVVLSATLAGRLTAYLSASEEALDTRRGWLIDKALKACSAGGE